MNVFLCFECVAEGIHFHNSYYFMQLVLDPNSTGVIGESDDGLHLLPKTGEHSVDASREISETLLGKV